MLKRVLFIILLLAGPAYADNARVPGISLLSPPTSPTDGTNKGYVDGLLNGLLNGFTMGGAPDSSHPEADGSVAANNLGTGIATQACPTSTQNSTSMLCIRGRTGSTPGQNYMVNINLDSYVGATHDVVGLYAGVRVHAGAPQSWTYNSVCHIEPGGGGCIGSEIDLNNWNCDAGDDGGAAEGCDMKTPIGLLITGSSPHPSGPAIAITGASVGNAQWHRGIEMLGGHIIDQASIWTDNASANDYVMRGVHAGSGLEMSAGVFAGSAIHMAEGHNLLWTGAGGAHNMFVDAVGYHFGSPTGAFVTFDNMGNTSIPGSAVIGSNAVIGGSAKVPDGSAYQWQGADGAGIFYQNSTHNYLFAGPGGFRVQINSNTGEVNTSGQVTANSLTVAQSTTLGGNVMMNNNANVAGRVAVGALTVALHTPASSTEACTPGSTSDDANFHYVCTATNQWKRVALSTF